MCSLTVPLTALLILSLAALGCLGGGTKLVYSLPAYGLVALAALFSPLHQRRGRSQPGKLCVVSSVIFFGYLLIRAHFSPVQYLARADVFLVLGSLTIYGLTASVLTGRGARLAVCGSLLLFGIAHLAVGAIQFSKGNGFQPIPFLQREGAWGIRASGFFTSPDRLAGFLEIVILLGLSLACWGRSKLWVRMLLGYATLLCVAGMLITGSRGGYLSALFGVGVFAIASLWLAGKRFPNRLGWILVASSLALVTAGIGINYLINQHWFLQSRVAAIADTTDARVILWRMALNQFMVSPVFGTGSGTLLYYARFFRDPNIVKQEPVYAHNDYLHLLAEYGAVGEAAFLLFLLAHLVAGWKAVTSRVDRNAASGVGRSNVVALGLGALSAVAAYMIHSIFDFNLHIPANAMTLAFVFGILANSGVGRVQKTDAKVRRPWPVFPVMLPILGAAMLWWGLPTWPSEYFLEQSKKASSAFDFQASIALATEGLRSERKNPYLYLFRGESEYEAGAALDGSRIPPDTRDSLLDAAVADYREGIKLFPQDRVLLLGMGQTLDELKRFDEAEPYYQDAMERDPNSAYVRCRYASHLLARGDIDGAEREFRHADEITPSIYASQGIHQIQAMREKSSHEGPQNPK